MIFIKNVCTYSLITCHCEVCNIIHYQSTEYPAHRGNPILRSTVPKTLFRLCFKLWDCRIKHLNPTNHFIYRRLIRNDNFVRLFFFPKALPLGQSMLPLRGGDFAGIVIRFHNHDLFFKLNALFQF